MYWDFNKRSSMLDITIENLFAEMASVNGDSKEYEKMTANMDTLYKLKLIDADVSKTQRVTPDTMLLVASNILAILIVVSYEQKGVLTSKALMFLRKST